MFPHSYGKFGHLGDDEHELRLAAPPTHEQEEGATRRPFRPRPIWRGSAGRWSTYKVRGPVHQPSGARARKVIMSPRRSFSTARSWHARAGDTPDSSHVNIKEYPRLPVSKSLVPSAHTAGVPVHACATLASLLPWAEHRARMVSGALPSKPHESATANFGISGDLLLVNAKSNTPFSRAALVCNHKFRCPASVSSMWSADAFHGRSSRSGLSTPGLFLHLLHQCVDGVGLPAAPGRRCRRGAPGIGQVTPRQTIRQHRCEPEA
jgi:hypothetical protein